MSSDSEESKNAENEEMYQTSKAIVKTKSSFRNKLSDSAPMYEKPKLNKTFSEKRNKY